MRSFPLLRLPADPVSLSDLARLLGVGLPEGPGAEVKLRRVATLEGAGPDALAPLGEARYLARAAASGAGAFLLAASLAKEVEASEDPRLRDRPRLVVSDPPRAVRRILLALHPELPAGDPVVHPTAVVDPEARVGEGARVGPYAVVEVGAEVGEGSEIGAHVVVGARARIGPRCRLLPHAVVYPDTVLGAGVILHAGARVGVDGFGYVFEEGAHARIPHVGGCVLEDEVEVGANTCIDRGSIGETRIGRGTKIDNLVHVGHNTRVGPLGLLAAQAGISGSVVMGTGVAMGGQAGVAGHLEVGDGARLAAQAGIIGDVPPGETVLGFPARPQRTFLKATAALYRLPEVTRRLRQVEAALEALAPGGGGPAPEG